MRTEELYEALLPREVVTFDEIVELVSRLSVRRDRTTREMMPQSVYF